MPAGKFAMGSSAGYKDEQPIHPVTIEKPFWMAKFEINNRLYKLFDSEHDSRYLNPMGKDQGNRGVPMNKADQPVVRVSWERASEFCRWLSQKTGLKFELPTEAQWEYACRAGTDTPLFYGEIDADFSKYANVADRALMLLKGKKGPPGWRLGDGRYGDHGQETMPVGYYQPNAWGLHDMHGNAAEWVRSSYMPYPYNEDDGRNSGESNVRKVARGGSFYDRPKRCVSSFRLSYPAWRRVYNVGFRVVADVSKDQSRSLASAKKSK
ncbi:formylglycine-generating enzyme family protein [Verrucomicrobiota bacterium]